MPNAAAFRDWGSYMEFAIPSVLTLCSDWWAIEIIVFISGYLGVIQQASFVILVSMGAQLAQVTVGVGKTACMLIGNAIGSQDATLAKRWFNMTLLYTLIYCIAIQFVLIPSRELIAGVFTGEQDVKALVIACMPVVVLKFICDGFQCVLACGVLPSLGM